MEFAINELGAERIMIGSDYCLDRGYDQPMHVLDEVNMDSAQRKLILAITLRDSSNSDPRICQKAQELLRFVR
jgi:hypothetical protein